MASLNAGPIVVAPTPDGYATEAGEWHDEPDHSAGRPCPGWLRGPPMGEPNRHCWTEANNDPIWRRVDDTRSPGADDPNWRFHRTPVDEGDTCADAGGPFNQFGDHGVVADPFN